MIDEHDLRALLAEAAEAIPPPGRAPQALLDAIASEEQPTVKARPRRLTLVATAAAVVAVVALGATVALDPSAEDSNTVASLDAPTAGTASGGGDEAESEQSSDGGSPDGVTHRNVLDLGSTPAPLAPGEASSEGGGTGVVGAPTDSAKVIRTGSLDLEVRKGAFQSTVARITSQTVGLGGYIAESTTSESGESPSGSIIVRVPGDSFETLLADLRKLGDVKAVTSKGTDVTAQFTDLEARLTALRATRDRLQAVLAEAANVSDILAVQDRITVVQVEIEQAQGQQKLLEDQTAFATLAVTLGEPGAEIIEIETEGDEGLGGAWDDARRRFGDNLETIVSWSGSAAVALIIGFGLLFAGRFAWMGFRRRIV